jgi:hypothetical protein
MPAVMIFEISLFASVTNRAVEVVDRAAIRTTHDNERPPRSPHLRI